MDEAMICWDEVHPIYGRGDTCQACGCGWGSEVHRTGRFPTSVASSVWWCTPCAQGPQERLRRAVLGYHPPTQEGWYVCQEHLETVNALVLVLNAARHAGEEGDDPSGDLADDLLAHFYGLVSR